MNLLKLKSGRTVTIEGDGITQKEAIEIAKELINMFKIVNIEPKAEYKLLIEIEPEMWSDCPHYETLEEALEGEGYKSRKG